MNYGDKVYIFSEYHEYDSGGMDCKEFANLQEAKEYLRIIHKDPEELERLISYGGIRVIVGREHKPTVKEKTIVKEIELG